MTLFIFSLEIFGRQLGLRSPSYADMGLWKRPVEGVYLLLELTNII